MSRCGSCPIYDSTEYGVYCPGNYGVEECADKLQDLYYAMSDEIKSLKISTSTPSNVPLTLEELREMGGKPNRHVGLQEDSPPPHWNVLDPFYARHIEDYGYGKRWLAYRYELEGGVGCGD